MDETKGFMCYAGPKPSLSVFSSLRGDVFEIFARKNRWVSEHEKENFN